MGFGAVGSLATIILLLGCEAGGAGRLRRCAVPPAKAMRRHSIGWYSRPGNPSRHAQPRGRTTATGTATRSEPRRIGTDVDGRRKALTCASGTSAYGDEPLECDLGACPPAQDMAGGGDFAAEVDLGRHGGVGVAELVGGGAGGQAGVVHEGVGLVEGVGGDPAEPAVASASRSGLEC